MPTDQTLQLLEANHGVANNDSKMTPQEESNIMMLPLLEPVSQFMGHQDLSLQVEVLMVTPSKRKMMPTIVTSTS